jgi:hypothetical protein
MSQNPQEKIDQALQQIAKTLKSLTESKQDTANLMPNFEKQIEDLKSALITHSSPIFPYEFYEQGSQITEQITALRLDKDRQQRLLKTSLFKLLNRLVSLLRDAVYRHPALNQQTASIDLTNVNSIENAREKIQAAMQVAKDAGLAAQEANAQGAKYLKEIAAEQKKTAGLIDAELLKTSTDHTLTIYAKNAAAVIATDQVAAAIMELDQLLQAK